MDKETELRTAAGLLMREGYLFSATDIAIRDGSDMLAFGTQVPTGGKGAFNPAHDKIERIPLDGSERGHNMTSSFAAILKTNPELGAVLLSRGPFTSAAARRGKPMRAYLDDMAQMLGPRLKAKRGRVAPRKMKTDSAILLRDEGVLCAARNLYEAHALAMVTEKSALAMIGSRAVGRGKAIAVQEAILMRLIYWMKYSKQAGAGQKAKK